MNKWQIETVKIDDAFTILSAGVMDKTAVVRPSTPLKDGHYSGWQSLVLDLRDQSITGSNTPHQPMFEYLESLDGEVKSSMVSLVKWITELEIPA